MRTVIKNILYKDQIIDIEIFDDLIVSVGAVESTSDSVVIDGSHKAVFPGFINGHTHSAMTLFRGFGDDLPLEKWLNEYIWPYESRLTTDMIYWGAKLACLEMIETGTTTFNDMYFKTPEIARAISDMGLRGYISEPILDFFDLEQSEFCKQKILADFKIANTFPENVHYTITPHAIYTVSGKLLQWISSFATENNLLVHMHLAETKTEYDNCIRSFGVSPVKYLHRLDMLNNRLVLAHCIWLDEEDMDLLARYEVGVVHNPCSNLKLASGYKFRYHELKERGVKVGLGTDGCGSSNNLNMLGAMKTAALMQKGWRHDPTALPAQEALLMATQNMAEILNLNAGEIKEGSKADMCIIDLNTSEFTPNHNTISNLVYSASGMSIDTVVCNGKILMQNKEIKNKNEIFEHVQEIAIQLIKN